MKLGQHCKHLFCGVTALVFVGCSSPEQLVAPSTITTSSSSPEAPQAVVDPSTTTIPGPSDRYREPTLEGVSPEHCRLLDQSPDTRSRFHLSTGFPVETANFAPFGTFKIALIPIDFDDFAGSIADLDEVLHHTQMVSDWYTMVSGGQVTIEWQIHESWLRVPRNLADFALDRSRSDDNRLARAAFKAVDPLVDFTDVRATMFLLPTGQPFMAEGVQGFLHSQFGGEGGFSSEEGRIYNYAIGGSHWEKPHKELWSYWAHEMGHMFPLPDLYDVRGQWWNGIELEIPGGPFSQFDMMANQDGPSRTLSTWLRFMMGWLDDSQVLCLDTASRINGDVTLVHTDADEPGIKSVMIPLDSKRLVVIESRRPNETFDCPTSTKPSRGWRVSTGLLVFTADMTIGHGNAFQRLVAPEGRSLHEPINCGVPPQLDAILTPGDSVTVEGITITVNESGNYDHFSINFG